MNSWKACGTVTCPWMHPEATTDVRWALRLRLRLMPYLYALCRAATDKGEPPLRPLFYDFGERDPETWCGRKQRRRIASINAAHGARTSILLRE